MALRSVSDLPPSCRSRLPASALVLILYRCAALQRRGPKRCKRRRSAAEALQKVLSSVWDNGGKPLHYRIKAMPTIIKAADLIESIAAALQYIS